jgi:aspartate/tyrosine/aromatic aminotransferase
VGLCHSWQDCAAGLMMLTGMTKEWGHVHEECPGFRWNIAGINHGNVDRVADSIAAVLK